MVIEDGNPADSTTALRMVERQVDVYGRAPRQVTFDGGYASKENVAAIKAAGVKDVAFHKKRGLQLKTMVKSAAVYKKLVKFRAGVEGNIATLKAKYGMRRCNWRGYKHFQAYAWLGVTAYNLVTYARSLAR